MAKPTHKGTEIMKRKIKYATKKDIRKWFPFLNSWAVSDEPKMLKEIHQRQREIYKAKQMSQKPKR